MEAFPSAAELCSAADKKVNRFRPESGAPVRYVPVFPRRIPG